MELLYRAIQATIVVHKGENIVYFRIEFSYLLYVDLLHDEAEFCYLLYADLLHAELPHRSRAADDVKWLVTTVTQY